MGHPTMQENDTAKLTPTLYILMFIICLTIPDYLVRQKTKK